MGKRIIAFIVLILTIGCAEYHLPDPNIGSTASFEEKLESIDKWLAELADKRKFNGSIVISRNSTPLLMNAYGYADRERTIPLTKRSCFRLASVSKQFTAMAMMLLKERGLLEFDDLVKNFLPEFPYSSVSIRHLLTHTSGIPDYEDLVLSHYLSFFTFLYFTTNQSMDNLFYTGDPGLFKDRYDILTMKDVLSLVVKYRDQKKFEPGERYSYSNTGYVLLAYIVEMVSGQDFETFLSENIFEYLGMESSSVWNLLSVPNKLPHRVEGTNGNRLNDYTWLDGIAGDGAVFVSAEDFLKWDRALADHTLVSPAVFKEATTPFITASGDTSYYGFGWRISKKGDLMNHTGNWVGALTYISRRPEKGTMFVLLDSSTNKYYFEIRDKIIKILDDEDLF